MESGALGKEAAALRITVVAGVSCSCLLLVVAELERQCSVNIDLRQGLAMMRAAVLDPGARKSTKTLLI